MELLWTKNVSQFFTGKEKDQFIQEIQKKIPAYIQNHYYRIKPVHSLEKASVSFYELRMHIGKKDYRVAFFEQGEQKVVCYISATLQKVNFEKEMKKWYRHHFEQEKIQKIGKDD